MDEFAIWHWVVATIFFGPALLGIFVFKQGKVYLRHRESGLPKIGRIGWSWTYLYFGWLVPVFRGEIGMGILHFLLSVVSLGLFQFLWSFLYNKQHLTRLMTQGWALDTNSPNYQEMERRLGISM